MGVSRQLAGRALRCNLSLRAERGNLLKISLNMLAKPGFSLHSLTQIELLQKNYSYLIVPCLFKKHHKNQLFF